MGSRRGGKTGTFVRRRKLHCHLKQQRRVGRHNFLCLETRRKDLRRGIIGSYPGSKKDGIYYASGALGHMRGHSMICAIEDPQKMAVFKNDRPTADSLIHLRESTSTQGLKMIADYGAYKNRQVNSRNRQVIQYT